MSDLLGCPICNGSAYVATEHDTDGYYWAWVACRACGLRTRGKWASTSATTCPQWYEEVRDEWNRRTPPAQVGKGEVVARITHSADAISRMEITTAGIVLGYGTHDLFTGPAAVA